MIITRTPYRISFAGGGTDLPAYYQQHDGMVVSVTINKYIWVTVNRRFDDTIRVSYSKTEIVQDVDELQHDIVKACLKHVGIAGGIEITSIGDIPSGTGLGSSSSFTVGLLNALYTYKGENLSSRELAEKACEIEIDVLKHPIGKQDQFAAAYGGLNAFRFHADGTVSRRRLELSDKDIRRMENRLVLFYTGVRRNADNILKEQSRETLNQMDSLDFMREQAERMETMLMTEGFIEEFAALLHQSWLKKRSLAQGISNQQINQLYKTAIESGAKGGKLLGAGGGGFFLFYCKEDHQKELQKALGSRELEWSMTLHGSRVVYLV